MSAPLRGLVFMQREDGAVTVDEFPQVASIASELLERIRDGRNGPTSADGIAQVHGDRLHITVANGSAVYRITEVQDTPHSVLMQRESGVIQTGGA